ncbi:hypothetical protein RRG08_007652 [Elysia crispata]|uniref:Uncharacterized protein n=1 Tax=Elysia crispata TaxID=231223 RepID=A0AAE1CRZ1_9GAST|nr:hypothetical protein RRG08_007652 [Elysia crispata]
MVDGRWSTMIRAGVDLPMTDMKQPLRQTPVSAVATDRHARPAAGHTILSRAGELGWRRLGLVTHLGNSAHFSRVEICLQKQSFASASCEATGHAPATPPKFTHPEINMEHLHQAHAAALSFMAQFVLQNLIGTEQD